MAERACGTPSAAQTMQDTARARMKDVPHKILVLGGKGGVGKTTVAVNLAFALAKLGYRVGLLDADLHGPDVPLMTGVEGRPGEAHDSRLIPIDVGSGVRVLSIASFLPGRDSPVIWRGPRKASAIAQFLAEGDWTGIDVLVVDCPPGTWDEPLSVAQMIPDADGVVVVTSPQDVALLDSRKCVGFARELELPILGIVENLSGFVCPGCGRVTSLFKTGGGERAATDLDVPFLGRIPISETVVDACDSGRPIVRDRADDPAARALSAVAARLAEHWSPGSSPAGTSGKGA